MMKMSTAPPLLTPSPSQWAGTQFALKGGERVLLLGNPAVPAESVEKVYGGILEAVKSTGFKLKDGSIFPSGSVRFEQLDRLDQINLPTASFDLIISGTLFPPAFPHTSESLIALSKAMAPGSRIHIIEPILRDAACVSVPDELSPMLKSHPSLKKRIPCRTWNGLVGALKIVGLVDIEAVDYDNGVGIGEASSAASIIPIPGGSIKGWQAPRSILETWVTSSVWGVGAALEVTAAMETEKALVDAWENRVYVVHIVATKPQYEVGSATKLSFRSRKQKPALLQQQSEQQQGDSIKDEGVKLSPTEPTVNKETIWRVAANDDEDEELEDDEGYLDDDDKKGPIIAATTTRIRGGFMTACNASEIKNGKRKACKTCSCGYDSHERVEATLELLADSDLMGKRSAPSSSCGTCSLGDAFRCTSCPYSGTPSFKPGDKVVLSGQYLHDDLES
ncbi:Anamorsin [Blyttiomyces sp. JEL0837]|nr:Anamorsin [Blyttiomyces sp. JEL0837]